MDHHGIADDLVRGLTKDDDEKIRSDPKFYEKQSRVRLLYQTAFTDELITIAKGIRLRLTVIAGLLFLCALGVVSLRY
jgi:hypothetical protein